MNILDRLEVQRNGGRIFQDVKIAFKDLCGFTGSQSEICGCPLFACRFSPLKQYGDLVAFANEDGKVEITNSAKNTPGTVSQAHYNAIFDLCWTNRSPKIITASGDYTAQLWDVGDGAIKSIRNFTGHTRSLKTVSCHPLSDDFFATGSRDGNIMLWDSRVTTHTGSVTQPENVIRTVKKNSPISVTSISFLDEYHLISASSNEGCLKVWDTRRSYSAFKRLHVPSYIIPPPGRPSAGYSCVTVDPARLLVYANSVENIIYSFAVANYDFTLCGKFTGHKVNSFYIKHSLSRNGKLLACGSDEGDAYIWDTKRPGPPVVALHGHTAEVTAVDWSFSGETKMVTCSDDMTYMLWKLHPCNDRDFHPDIKGYTEGIDQRENITKSVSRKPRTASLPLFKIGKNVQTSPVKVPSREIGAPPVKKLKLSPMKSPTKSMFLQSPTANLPNYVMDGKSPHQHECRRSPRQHPDWLTKLRESRTPQRNGKTPSESPGRRIARQRNSASKSSSILNFFSPSSSRSKPRSLNFSHLPANSDST